MSRKRKFNVFDILQLLLSHFKYCFYKPLTLKRRICESGHGALLVNAMHVILQVERKCFTKRDVFFSAFALKCNVCVSTESMDKCKSLEKLQECPSTFDRCFQSSQEYESGGIQIKAFGKGCSTQDVCEQTLQACKSHSEASCKVILKADVSSVSPSSERIEGLWVTCSFYSRVGATLLVVTWQREK